MLTEIQAARPLVTPAEGVALTCDPVPKLAPGVPSFEGLLGHALVLHDAYVTCAGRNETLVRQATGVKAPPAK